jgi:hypothetical protein
MRVALIVALVIASSNTSNAAIPSYAYVEEVCRVMGQDILTASVAYSDWGSRRTADLTARRLWFVYPFIRFRIHCRDVLYS